jgi:hypothetical protein
MSNPGSDSDDFKDRLHAQELKLHEAIRHEAFVQGFVSARGLKTALETLLVCTDADTAYAEWRAR